MNSHFLLLFLFLTTATTTTTAATTTIRDTSGRPLRANTSYYILPALHRTGGGGLTMVPKNKTLRCPLYVAQDPHKPSNGLPLKFLPADPKQTLISGSDLNIVFDVPGATTCVGSTMAWEVGFDEPTRKRFITTGGDIGNPGVDTLGSWFSIQKAKTGRFWYKIRFCPGVCIFCTVLCGDVRVSVQKDGKRLLELVTDSKPLWVMFKKAY